MRDFNKIRQNFYHKYSKEEVENQLVAFINQDLDLTTFDNKGKKYDKIINTFFEKNIYSARNQRCKISPDEALYDEELLRKIYDYIDTKPNFYTGDDVANLKTFFRNAGKWACKVANFSPNVARKIYEKYMPKENANILDYSCGFGSRMLGCLSSKYNYRYFGIDPNTDLCKKLNAMGKFINNVKPCIYKIFCQGSEDFKLKSNTIDFAFSSPPYFNLEKYSDEDTQCYNKFSELNNWFDGYVQPTIENIYNMLKPDRYYAVNIADFKIGNKNIEFVNQWIDISVNTGFIFIKEIPMNLQTRRGQGHNDNTFKKQEGIYLFKKTK